MRILFQTDDGRTIRTIDPLGDRYLERIRYQGVNITQLLLDDCLKATFDIVEVECEEQRKLNTLAKGGAT